MRNGKIYLRLLSFIMVFLLYLTDVFVAMAAPDAEAVEKTVSQNTVSDSASEDPEYETVSTADEFTKWLDSHRSNGGRVRLTKDIVLREFYFFSPAAANRPDIFVDTDSYTITAAGKITFLSDGHLIFQGKAGNRGILRAAKGSLLTLDGVIVEDNAQTSDSYAVWQEEGAGFVVGKTYVESRITGDIHYADIPFVTQTDSICVVVEKGQSVDGLLPDRIKCRVNRQGQIEDNVQIPVSWDLTGTERQQEKRLRFQVRGTSSEAVFDVPSVCTVVYNDYPLTFTTVNAFIQASAYYFQGGYTKPEKELPIAVAAEYSFDGDNWITGNEENVSDINAGFSIYFPCDQWDSDKYPSVYIRLRGDKDGKEFLSNVLRYEANNMGEAEDIGGSRGGGTSIINPPENPQQSIVDDSSDEKQVKAADSSSDSGNAGSQTGSDTASDNTTAADHRGADMIQGEADGGQSSMEENSGADREQPLYGGQSHADTEQPPYEEQNHAGTEQPLYGEQNHAGTEQPPYEEQSNTGTKQSLYAGAKAVGGEESSSVSFSRANEQAVYSDTHKRSYLVIAIGFVLLSAVSGIVGFYIHSHSGTNR